MLGDLHSEKRQKSRNKPIQRHSDTKIRKYFADNNSIIVSINIWYYPSATDFVDKRLGK